METKSEKPLKESIITVQKQIRIAIQNYDILIGRLKLLQNRDEEIKGHMEVTQSLLQNMGRTQNELMNNLRNEIATKRDLKPNSIEVNNIMKKLLVFPDAPKHIPVYKYTNSENENKKSTPSWKPKFNKSVLKVNNKDVNDIDKKKLELSNSKLGSTKIKIIYNKKKDGNSILIPQSKKLQSILKCKNIKVNNEKFDEGQRSPESVSSSSSGDTKDKGSPPLRTSPVEEPYTTDTSISSSRAETRYSKKHESKLVNSNFRHGINIKQEPLDLDYKDSDTIPRPQSVTSRVSKIKHRNSNNPINVDEIDQETFLSFFRLVSIEKCEVLKRKRCERKRRSVAGQSSLYSDYLQPQPKRAYTPRNKPVVHPPPVAPAPPPPPKTGTNTNSNAIIVEFPPDDDDEKTTKNSMCCICHDGDGDDKCILEACIYCGETYHFNCIPKLRKGFCPSCMAESTNIPSIVGAEEEVNLPLGNTSNLENIIKRYSREDMVSGKPPNFPNKESMRGTKKRYRF